MCARPVWKVSLRRPATWAADLPARLITAAWRSSRDPAAPHAQPLPARLGVRLLNPGQWPVYSTDVQVEVAPALVVLQVSTPVVFAPLYAPVPPLIVNVPLYVAAVALV